ncbi:MAG: type II toxin-antitoxin system PemK/MazF family toxin [Candidatus Kapabacteria bacterium]|nr:type II toxin-antitoxin system PemK/MazF family toxin [Candidatus Kapabacteria bacterium]
MNQDEVWMINLDPTIGAEIQKIRPAVIVSDNAFGKLPLKVIVPITDWKDKYALAPWMVKIEHSIQNGLIKESSADTFQVRSVSELRLIRKIGTLTKSEMIKIKKGLSGVLSIEN